MAARFGRFLEREGELAVARSLLPLEGVGLR
jgi:hypothetical protein